MLNNAIEPNLGRKLFRILKFHMSWNIAVPQALCHEKAAGVSTGARPWFTKVRHQQIGPATLPCSAGLIEMHRTVEKTYALRSIEPCETSS
jgi:hypothetical protein